MIACPVCQHQAYDGTLFCDECGNQLWEEKTRPAPMVDGEESIIAQRFGSEELRETLGPADAAPPPAALARGDPIDPTVNRVVLRVQGTRRPIHLSGKAEYRLGRGDPRLDRTPDVDLGPYRALELGVSRLHALLETRGHGLTLTDLGSTNGTLVNGVRLRPNSPKTLRDGDELRLGKLALRVFFELR